MWCPPFSVSNSPIVFVESSCTWYCTHVWFCTTFARCSFRLVRTQHVASSMRGLHAVCSVRLFGIVARAADHAFLLFQVVAAQALLQCRQLSCSLSDVVARITISIQSGLPLPQCNLQRDGFHCYRMLVAKDVELDLI